MAFFEASYGRTLAALGRRVEAESLLVGAQTRIVAALGSEHPRSIEVAQDLAKLQGTTTGQPRN